MGTFQFATTGSKQDQCHHQRLVSDRLRDEKVESRTGFYDLIHAGQSWAMKVVAGNLQCHDCDRRAKVNRMTLRFLMFGEVRRHKPNLQL